MDDSQQTSPTSGPPPAERAGRAPDADPLLGDWSEGLPGPLRALGVPTPKLLDVAAFPIPLPGPAVAESPAALAPAEEVAAPDAWGAASEDPLQSEPPPSVVVAPELAGPLPDVTPAEPAPAFLPDVTPAEPAPAFVADVTPAEPAPVFLPDVTPAEPAPAFFADVTTATPAPVFEEPPAPEAAASAVEWEAAPPEPEAAAPAVEWEAAPPEPEAAAPAVEWEAAPPEPEAAAPAVEWEAAPAAPEAAEDAWEAPASEHHAAVQSEIETAEPIVELGAADEAPAWDAPAAEASAPDVQWEAAPAEEGWEPAPAQPQEAAVPEDAAADWSSLQSGPDWSAPAEAAPAAETDWNAPAEPAAAWSNDAAWAAPAETAAASTDWTAAPAPAEPEPEQSWTNASLGNNTLAQMEGEPEPIPAEPGAAEHLFGSVPVGGSLSEEVESELPDVEEIDDLPVALDDESALRPLDDEPATSPEQTAPFGLVVPGEHRVAIHTRGGSTRRGVLRDVDLSQHEFALAPQGGGADEPVLHDDVKAIFFMLPPGVVPSRASGRSNVKVTFNDGRSIEGERDGEEDPRGFFLVPSDAARTNTWRIYVAREATAEIRDL
jgi:hypothetical protein